MRGVRLPVAVRGVRLPVALVATLLLAGCSTTPRSKEMRVAVSLPRTHPHPLLVHVEGGGRADWQVHDYPFQLAVAQSLVSAKAFSSVVKQGDTGYRLDVVLGDLRQPIGGLNEPTQMTVLWSLSSLETGETVWQELVASTGHSTNFFGAWRIRNAAEEAARENIRQAIERLAEADLPREHGAR